MDTPSHERYATGYYLEWTRGVPLAHTSLSDTAQDFVDLGLSLPGPARDQASRRGKRRRSSRATHPWRRCEVVLVVVLRCSAVSQSRHVGPGGVTRAAATTRRPQSAVYFPWPATSPAVVACWLSRWSRPSAVLVIAMGRVMRCRIWSTVGMARPFVIGGVCIGLGGGYRRGLFLLFSVVTPADVTTPMSALTLLRRLVGYHTSHMARSSVVQSPPATPPSAPRHGRGVRVDTAVCGVPCARWAPPCGRAAARCRVPGSAQLPAVAVSIVTSEVVDLDVQWRSSRHLISPRW